MKLRIVVTIAVLGMVYCQAAWSFCGFYVAKADTKLFNKASKVVLVRDQDRTVLTMANDYQGDLKEFAIVIPVPMVLQREQIHVTNNAILDHLDVYSAPRLVEYFDRDPCQPEPLFMLRAESVTDELGSRSSGEKGLGVTIEAEYTVGEYDIVILSAKESSGLETWLKQNDYKIPKGAKAVLGSYIKQGMRFFLAKVNLDEQSKLGFNYLRPLQMAFESPKFMLPIRLGTVNANGEQELFVFAMTRQGRVEPTNYRMAKLPSNMEVPLYVKTKFAEFYQDMFTEQVRRENMRTVFLEYAWDMSWCDPCAADPLTDDELRELGVFWVEKYAPQARSKAQARNVYITRMHVRYTAETFPEDLMFQVTNNRENFQGRYIINHPWKGKAKCDRAEQYYSRLVRRQEKEASNLATLTGWNINEIRKHMAVLKASDESKKDGSWWKSLWKE
ncbi:DUF2330 domain-containing protein [Kaarinaea lacus]